MYKLVVLFSVLALAAANSDVWPLTYSVVPVSSVSQFDWFNGTVPTFYSAPYNPYFPSVIPTPVHTPTVVVDPVTGVPLDTPVVARFAHYPTNGLAVHQIAKRSADPVTYNTVFPVSPIAPVVRSVATPFTYPSTFLPTYPTVAPYNYNYGGFVEPKALPVYPWPLK